MVKYSIILVLSKITKLIIRKYMYKFIHIRGHNKIQFYRKISPPLLI